MTILSVVQEAAPKIGIARPTVLVADTGKTSIEIQATLAEVAGQIRDRYDWQAYKAIGTLTGDGVALSFAFPTNYARMTKTARLWPSDQPNAPLSHIDDSDTWLGMQVQDFSAVVGAWTIYGDRIYVNIAGATAPLGSADTVKFFHITNLQFADSGGTAKATITADDDVFRLTPERAVGERVLRLGFIAKWKQDRGRPYAQDMSDFEDALAVAIGNDKGAKSPLVIGRQRVPADWDMALPWGVTP